MLSPSATESQQKRYCGKVNFSGAPPRKTDHNKLNIHAHPFFLYCKVSNAAFDVKNVFSAVSDDTCLNCSLGQSCLRLPSEKQLVRRAEGLFSAKSIDSHTSLPGSLFGPRPEKSLQSMTLGAGRERDRETFGATKHIP